MNQGESQASVKIHILNNKIKRSRSEIEKYQRKMRGELKKIKNKTYYAANNNAGANYLNALSNEMSAVAEKYKVYIDLEKDTIQGYRDDISFLKGR
jgi:vacuolar-type H+-ATPase subunit E/Vma4